MTSPTIHLSAAEAALVNSATKAAGSPIRVTAGDVTLQRAAWVDSVKWLEWAATDLEISRELSERKRLLNLAGRIDQVIGRFDAAAGIGRKPGKVKERDLFAGMP